MESSKKIPDWVQNLLVEEDSFWKVNYPKFSFDEKVEFWSGQLHRKMRWQVESGLDPYAIYSIDWYNEVKKAEPNIDLIMNEAFKRYWGSTGGEWSKEEYLKKIPCGVVD
jgi:hypothetical protein